MSVTTKEELLKHLEHKIEVAYYGEAVDNPESVTIECIDCKEVLVALGEEKEEEEFLVGPCRFQREDIRIIAEGLELGLSEDAIEETWQEMIPYLKHCESVEHGNFQIEDLLAEKYG